jgi:hypothetical protein
MSNPNYSEDRVTVLGLSAKIGRMVWSPSAFKLDRWNDSLFCHQTLGFSKSIERGRTIHCDIRFDDNCKNGRNSFSITGHIIDPSIRGADKWECGGCIHEEIAHYFPELAHLIKWHLCDTAGPMHYPGNVTYHAGDRDYHGLKKGEVRSYDDRFYFGDNPISIPCKSKKFAEFALSIPKDEAANLEVIPVDNVPREPGGFRYTKYTLSGFYVECHYCPFDTFLEASQFIAGMSQGLRLGRHPRLFSEGKKRDLKAARSCAVWPDAPDKVLFLDKPQLEAVLLERLPKLIEDFRADVESLGFYWSAADYLAKGNEVTA